MPSVNEDILDAAIQHQIDVQQMIASTVTDLQGTLDDGNEQILEELLTEDAAINDARSTKEWRVLLAGLLAAIMVANRDANAAMNVDFRSYLSDYINYEADFQVSMLEDIVPIDVDVVSPLADELDAYLYDTPILGRYTDDWFNDYESATYDRVAAEINMGAVAGDDADMIAGALGDTAFLIGARQLTNMTRTLFNSAGNSARQAVADANPDLVGAVQWHAVLDSVTCETCSDLDGEVFDSEDDAPEEMPAHSSCRCFFIPVTRSAMKMGISADPELRKKMNGQPASKTRYADWLRRQSAKVQDDALGPSRGKLFRIGKLPIGMFTDSRHRILTLAELKQRHAAVFEKVGLQVRRRAPAPPAPLPRHRMVEHGHNLIIHRKTA